MFLISDSIVSIHVIEAQYMNQPVCLLLTSVLLHVKVLKPKKISIFHIVNHLLEVILVKRLGLAHLKGVKVHASILHNCMSVSLVFRQLYLTCIQHETGR